MDKGQVTIYIILGLSLIILVSIFYSNNTKKANNIKQPDTLSFASTQIKNYVEQCLLDITVPAIYNRLGLQGGFIDPEYNEEYGDYDQTEYKISGSLKIPYWYYNGKDISPTIEQVERRLGRYILTKSKSCTDFSQMDSLKGIKIIRSEVDHSSEMFAQEEEFINVNINDHETQVVYFYPITLKSGDEEKTIKEFYIKIPLSYGKDFALAKEVLKRSIDTKDSGGYDMTKDCENLKKGGYVNIYPINRVVKLFDYEPLYNEGSLFSRTFVFQFAYSDLQIYGYCMG